MELFRAHVRVMNMGGRGTGPFVFSLFSAIRYFSCFCSKSTCHDQGQIKPKKRGHVTQLFSRHGRILVLEVSRPILTEISRRLLSLVPCECMKRSIPICYGNSFAKCANQTSRGVMFRSPRSRGIYKEYPDSHLTLAKVLVFQ